MSEIFQFSETNSLLYYLILILEVILLTLNGLSKKIK